MYSKRPRRNYRPISRLYFKEYDHFVAATREQRLNQHKTPIRASSWIPFLVIIKHLNIKLAVDGPSGATDSDSFAFSVPLLDVARGQSSTDSYNNGRSARSPPLVTFNKIAGK